MIQYHACNQYTSTYYLVEKFFEKHTNFKLGKNSLKKKLKLLMRQLNL